MLCGLGVDLILRGMIYSYLLKYKLMIVMFAEVLRLCDFFPVCCQFDLKRLI